MERVRAVYPHGFLGSLCPTVERVELRVRVERTRGAWDMRNWSDWQSRFCILCFELFELSAFDLFFFFGLEMKRAETTLSPSALDQAVVR